MIKSKLIYLLPVLLIGATLLSSCEAIGGIFKAGVWTGTIGVVVVLVIIILVVVKLFSGKKN